MSGYREVQQFAIDFGVSTETAHDILELMEDPTYKPTAAALALAWDQGFAAATAKRNPYRDAP